MRSRPLAAAWPWATLWALLAAPAKALRVSPTRGIFPRGDVDLFEEDLLRRFQPERAFRTDLGKSLSATKPVMFIHVHKSAGTTMCSWAEHMGERMVTPHDYCASRRFQDYITPALSFTSPLWFRRNLTCEDRVSLFRGVTWNSVEHELCEPDLCFDAFAYVTVLRETVSRIQSQVNYEGPTEVEEILGCLETKVACPKSWAPTFFLPRGWMYLDNFLVRTFGGCNATNAGPGMVTREHMETAIANLKRFEAVIPLRELTSPRAQLEMDRIIGWHIKPTAEHEQITPSRYSITFSPGEVARLQKINSLDIELTNHFYKDWGIAPQKV